jgi:hypothetical protein
MRNIYLECTNKTSKSHITVEKYNKNTQKNKSEKIPYSLHRKLFFPHMNYVIFLFPLLSFSKEWHDAKFFKSRSAMSMLRINVESHQSCYQNLVD